MVNKYKHLFKPRPNFRVLLTDAEKAKLLYNRDMAFRRFVDEWNADIPELLAWTLSDFYHAYQRGGDLQLSLFN